MLFQDSVLLVLSRYVGEVGVELEVITKGDDDFGERGLSSFSMMESRFEVVMLISGKTWFQPCVEATCSIDLKYWYLISMMLCRDEEPTYLDSLYLQF